jgi:hypothetical protein
MNVEGLQVGGEKIFDLVLVPQSPGDYVLDGFRFSYFDPGRASYGTSTADPVRITVLPGERDAAGDASAGRAGPSIARRDIRHIKRGTINRDELALTLGGPAGTLIRYLPVVIALVGIVVSIQRRRAVVKGEARARKAFKVMMQDFKIAQQALDKQQDALSAAGIISRAIRGYLAARSGRSESAVDNRFIDTLTVLAPERKTQINNLLSGLDRVRFAPVSASPGEIGQLVRGVADLMRVVDKEWKE